MAGSLAIVPINVSVDPLKTVKNEWEINFARFFVYPSTTTTNCSDLLPLPPRLRNRYPRGNWISSSSTAFLRLVNDYSHSDLIISISFNGEFLEEHYVSKLQFSWPQVSCTSGFPARGIRTVIVSYIDSVGEIQKFAMRFPSFEEAQAFINTLKGTLKDKRLETPNTDFGSEVSSQSEFMSTNKSFHRAGDEHSTVKPLDAYIPKMSPRAGDELSSITPFDANIPKVPPSFNNEERRYSGTQEKETAVGYNSEGIYPALPPSFTSLLMDCSEIHQAQQTVSNESDLKSQIVKYMEDSSFQDILSKVEKIMSEIGGDMSLL